MEFKDYNFTENDLLDRKHIVDELLKYKKILSRFNSSTSVSIALNSKWGTGKTFFLGMWKNYFEENDNSKDKIIYYNAWENDDSDSAILPILYRIISSVTDKESEKYIEYVKNFLKTFAVETTKLGIKAIFGDNSKISTILEKGIDNCAEEEIQTVFDQFDKYYGNRKLLEKTLYDLVPPEGNLWIFIDDLDRCQPNFAINTLECIKHFFNIPGITYILAVDLEQIQLIAAKVYGERIDTNGYLKRFFDFIYQFPDADLNTFVKCRIAQMPIDEKLNQFIEVSDILNIAMRFNYSLRDMDLFLANLEAFLIENEVHIINSQNPTLTLYFYYYFLLLKNKYTVEYTDIIHGNFIMEEKKPTYRNVINNLFVVNSRIEALLTDISAGQAQKYDQTIFQKYGLFSDPQIGIFTDHMIRYLK